MFIGYNMKRHIINYIFLFFTFSTGIITYGQKSEKRPNVVVILADDLGWMDLSCQGSKIYETPNIDKLASDGIRFTQGYCAYPRCVPSRYGIITGRNPARVKLPGPWNWSGEEYTIAQAFKDAGYKTFFCGKWHLAKKDVMPQDKGFDINIAGGHAGATQSYFYPYSKEKGKSKNKIGLEEGGKPGEYLPDRLTDETINFIRENKDTSFFVFLSHYSVHTPFEAKESYSKYYKDKIEGSNFQSPEYITEGPGVTKGRQDNEVYAAMIKSLDESVGRVIKLIEELKLDKNTIIVFTSDNGGLSNRGYNSRQLATSNLPLRGGKGHAYEGGIRIPMIYKWPGKILTGVLNNSVVSTMDIYPTLAELAGIKLKDKNSLDGTSISKLLLGKKQNLADRPLFWHSPESRPYSTGDTSFSAIRLGSYKLIDFYDEKKMELYNIETDLAEKENLIEKNPAMAKSLLKKLNSWRKKTAVYYDDGLTPRKRQVDDD